MFSYILLLYQDDKLINDTKTKGGNFMVINNLDLNEIVILNYTSIARWKSIRIFYIENSDDTVIKTSDLDVQEGNPKRVYYNSLLDAVSKNRRSLTKSLLDEYRNQSEENAERLDLISELATVSKISTQLYEMKDRDIILSYTKDEYLNYLRNRLIVVINSIAQQIQNVEPSLLSKSPSINFDTYKQGNKKVFDTVRVTFTLIQGYGNTRDDLKIWLKKNKPMIDKQVKNHLSSALKKYGIPMNFLECSNVTLTRDNHFEYLFSIKELKNIDGN